MENSLKFYRDQLGLKIIKDMDEQGNYLDNMLSLNDVRVRTVKLSANENTTLVELLEFESHNDNKIRNFYTIGASHVAFTVDDIEKLYVDLSEKILNLMPLPKNHQMVLLK